MAHREKREFRRLPSTIDLELKVLSSEDRPESIEIGESINFSRTGLLVKTATEISPESRVLITVVIANESIQLDCLSMYSHKPDETGYETGLSIRSIKEEGKGTYDAYIDQLEADSEKPMSLRPGTGNLPGLISRISAEHKIITKYVMTIEKKLVQTEADPAGILSLIELMKKDLDLHFRIEERLFFDTARDFLPQAQNDLVLRLTVDHRNLIKSTNAIIEFLSVRVRNRESIPPPLRKKIEDLMVKIKNHAKIELVDLFPHIDKNTDIRNAIHKKIKSLS